VLAIAIATTNERASRWCQYCLANHRAAHVTMKLCEQLNRMCLLSWHCKKWMINKECTVKGLSCYMYLLFILAKIWQVILYFHSYWKIPNISLKGKIQGDLKMGAIEKCSKYVSTFAGLIVNWRLCKKWTKLKIKKNKLYISLRMVDALHDKFTSLTIFGLC
jgi:hypothetical protein